MSGLKPGPISEARAKAETYLRGKGEGRRQRREGRAGGKGRRWVFVV
jgi:hypothetical protein